MEIPGTKPFIPKAFITFDVLVLNYEKKNWHFISKWITMVLCPSEPTKKWCWKQELRIFMVSCTRHFLSELHCNLVWQFVCIFWVLFILSDWLASLFLPWDSFTLINKKMSLVTPIDKSRRRAVKAWVGNWNWTFCIPGQQSLPGFETLRVQQWQDTWQY